MAGYWIVRGTVKDQAAFEEYARLWGPVAKRYGARMRSGPGRHESREGKDYARIVIVEFDTYEQALACYDDPEYQASLPHALAAYDRDLVIVEGT